MKPELGCAGDLVPPCAVEQLGCLERWQARSKSKYPEALWDLRVFKCRQMFLLVIPGLRDGQPDMIRGGIDP